jgi:hypothetical protein
MAKSSGSGYQFLVSMPDFSSHVLRILPATFSSLETLIFVSSTMLFASSLVVTLIVTLVYLRRARVTLPPGLEI